MADPIEQEIRQLCQQIRRHDYLYYVLGRPEISDRQYDHLMARLQKLEAGRPDLVTADSPTQRIGDQLLEGFPKVSHARPMLSIDNTYSIDQVRQFDQRIAKALGAGGYKYVVDPKIDGVAVSLRYENGTLKLGCTRGDGQVGDDVTQNVRTIRAIPLRLVGDDFPEILELRGEVYWPRKQFAKFNEQRREADEPTLANPRNATAGTLKLLDSQIVAQRGLSFLCYGFGQIRGLTVNSHYQLAKLCRKWGIPVSKHLKLVDNCDQLIETIEHWRDARGDLDYQTDGMVAKIDDFAQRDKLGATSRAPRWCIAYKYQAEQAVTTVKHVRWQVGKLGTLTPVADLEPVWVSGTTVGHASLHNYDQIQRLDVQIGDTVVIEKAGEIIPQVIKVLHEKRRATKPVKPPTRCPACSGPITKDTNVVYIRCGNPSCPAQLKERLGYFASRNLMDIENLGPAVIDQLVDGGLVKELADLYKLKYDQLLELQRMGPKSASSLLEAIDQSKSRDLPQVLAALNIPNVGVTTALVLAEHFKSMDGLMDASPEQLQAVPDVGPVVAQNIYDFFHSRQGHLAVEHLNKVGVNMTLQASQPPAQSRGLGDKTLVVTGTLKDFSRKQVEDLIRQLGGQPSSSISSKTDFLIIGAQPGSKLDKARKLNVKILTEDQFLKLVDKKS